MTAASPSDILKKAILLEKRGRAFYLKAAEQTDIEALKTFFAGMAEEETRHIQILSDHFKNYEENQTFAPVPDGQEHDDDFAAGVLTPDIMKRIAAAGFEAAAVSAAMAMEERAIKLYSGRAAEAVDETEKKLYAWLAEWEGKHLSSLAAIDREITDQIWHDNNFWPY